MTEQSPFRLKGRNPDVLSCIANLSNDEVFTPPEFANRMLDTLAEAWASDNDGANVWENSAVTFLDPCTKSGVFLREIAKRLIEGLESEIPDLQERVDHILTHQVFGIGITQLTALLARRSLYCSKSATGEHSVVTEFDDADGNVWFQRTEHEWKSGKCVFCGANEDSLERGEDMETHAYAFIHSEDIKGQVPEIFGENMLFDVVIGNPPYQLTDGGGGTSAVPIYQHFVEQAKALQPRYISMVIPSRWFTGGKGLDTFRESMLSDNSLRSIHDFLSASEVFPGVGLKGGVNYFLWDRDNQGECNIHTSFESCPVSQTKRPLLEAGADSFIRFNEAVPILKKVMNVEGVSGTLALPKNKKFDALVSTRMPFGLASTFRGRKSAKAEDIEIYQRGGIAYADRGVVSKGEELIDAWKLFVGFAAPGTGNKDTYPHKVISTPFLGKPRQISTETYLVIGPFETEAQSQSALSYLSCHLTRFLIQLRKASQNTTKKVYSLVPLQDWDRIWTDDELYEKYKITTDEVAFIERLVRPMDISVG